MTEWVIYYNGDNHYVVVDRQDPKYPNALNGYYDNYWEAWAACLKCQGKHYHDPEVDKLRKTVV